jgi:hypothetical protein
MSQKSSLMKTPQYVPKALTSDNVGFAMSRIDEAEAAATLRVLNQLAEAQEEILAMQASAR